MATQPMTDQEIDRLDNPATDEFAPRCLKDRERERIAAQIAEFLANGGTITEVDSNVMQDALKPRNPTSVMRGSATDIHTNVPSRFSVNTAAVYLGIHHATLRQAITKGHMRDGSPAPQHHHDDKGIYFVAEDLNAWRTAQEQFAKAG